MAEKHYANPAYGRLMARAEARNQPVGTALSGYAPAKDGPFRCDNCVHFHAASPTAGGVLRPPRRTQDDSRKGTCDHPAVAGDPEIRIHQDGKPVVEAGGCCNEFRSEKARENG